MQIVKLNGHLCWESITVNQLLNSTSSTYEIFPSLFVDPCRPQNRGSHDYLRAHKGSRRMSRPLIQDSSASVLFLRYKGN